MLASINCVNTGVGFPCEQLWTVGGPCLYHDGPMPSSVRIKIIPSVKTAYVGGFKNFGAYAKISWPYIAIILLSFIIYNSLFYGFSISFLDKIYPGSGSSYLVWNFVGRFLRHLLEAIFIVGFYRFLILKDTEHLRTIAIKRGITKTNTMLSISFYFRFGTREILAPFIGFSYVSLKYLTGQLLSPVFYSGATGNQIIFEHPYLYLVIQYCVWVVAFPLLAGLCVFLLPYVATAEKLGFAGALRVIKAIKGNVIRVVIIYFLIFLPAYLNVGFSNFGFFDLRTILYSAIQFYSLSGAHWLLVLFDTFSILLWYCCLAAELYFVHLIYRKFVLNETIGPETENNASPAHQ